MPRIPRPRVSKRVWLILVGVFGVLVLSGGSAVGALAATGHLMAASPNAAYCVKFGNGLTANGNVVEFNWDGQACPVGTYPHNIADPDTVGTTTDDDSQFLTKATDTDTPATTDDDSGFLPNTFNTGGDTSVATPTTWTVLDYFDLNPNGDGKPMKLTCQYKENGSPGVVAQFCVDDGFLP